MDCKLLGTVKWYNVTKGYGFIVPDSGESDIYVHNSAVHEAGLDSLAPDERVEFCLGMGPSGRPVATDLELTEKPKGSKVVALVTTTVVNGKLGIAKHRHNFTREVWYTFGKMEHKFDSLTSVYQAAGIEPPQPKVPLVPVGKTNDPALSQRMHQKKASG